MRIFSDASRDATRHPDWCDRSRCQLPRNAGTRFGEHRSEPMTLGRVTLVIRQAPHESRPSIEVRATSRLTLVDVGDDGRVHALYAAMAIDGALEECAQIAREWQNDHSMRDHTSRFPSTPILNPFGGESR